MGMEIVFGGKKYFINSDRIQIIDLLLSTYENAIQKNGELAEANQQLLRMHRELAKKNHELEKLNKEKNKFLSMAAHDLRNPIGAILSFGLILQEEGKKKLSEDEQEFIKIIIKSSDFVLQLLNELLDIAVIESGELNLKKMEIEFANLVQNNIALNRVLADNKNIEISYETNIEEIEMNIDPVKIEQVLNNLISNAIKFSFPDSKIAVFIRKNENELLFGVKDLGQGIPATEINKLFIPFEKLSVRSTAGEKSTGLGLVIVKKIMEAHKGRVEVESKQGSGSTFICSLPL
jgi:signal transduction histidine kinase